MRLRRIRSFCIKIILEGFPLFFIKKGVITSGANLSKILTRVQKNEISKTDKYWNLIYLICYLSIVSLIMIIQSIIIYGHPIIIFYSKAKTIAFALILILIIYKAYIQYLYFKYYQYYKNNKQLFHDFDKNHLGS